MLDPDLFRSLVLNLVDNAGKALGSRGHIRVTVRMTGEGCRLCVEDDGPGIPGEARKHLTEAFYRVDKSRSRKQGGAGLGLTLCEKIVKLHNGELSFESEEGRGTKVTAELKGGRCEKENENNKPVCFASLRDSGGGSSDAGSRGADCGQTE